jgi:hypothetical protein
MIGSMLILMAMIGQPPAPMPAYPPAVVSKPGEIERARQWLLATSPIDGHPIHILGWIEPGTIRFSARDYPQFVPMPATATTSRPTTVPTGSVADFNKPTGVISSKFPPIHAGQSWTSSNAMGVIGETKNEPNRPEVYLTIIGPKRERERVKARLERDPEFQAVSREMGDRLAVEAYDPTNPLVADVGLPDGGHPDIVVLDATGKECERFRDDPGPSILADAVRKTDPSYRPGGDRGETGGMNLGWIAAGVIAGFFILRARSTKNP